jgi:hypothetical protein
MQALYYSRTFVKEENIFVFKTNLATCGVAIFYSAGVVTHESKIG